jgi:hypothetical protein
MELAVLCNGYETLRQNINIPAAGLTGIELEITPIVETPTELVLSGQNMPVYLWAGSIKDLSTGVTQAWGTINAQEPVHLNPLSGNQVIIQYQALDQWMNLQGWYFFYAEIPHTAGIITWDHSARRFVGGPTGIDLLNSNNKQFIKGTLVSKDTTNNIMTVKVAESIPVSGYIDVGQYFIGENITLYAIPPADISGAVEGEMKFEPHGISIPMAPWVIYVPGWTTANIRVQRTFPDSAYVFGKDIVAEYQTEGSYWPDAQRMIYGLLKIRINSVTGAVPQFKVVLGAVGQQVYQTPQGYYAVAISAVIRTFTGPLSNIEILGADIQQSLNQFYADNIAGLPPFQIWANPDMNAAFSTSPATGNWVLLASIPMYKFW